MRDASLLLLLLLSVGLDLLQLASEHFLGKVDVLAPLDLLLLGLGLCVILSDVCVPCSSDTRPMELPCPLLFIPYLLSFIVVLLGVVRGIPCSASRPVACRLPATAAVDVRGAAGTVLA